VNAGIVALTKESLEGEAERDVQEDLLDGQTDRDVFNSKQVGHTEDADTRDLDFGPDRIGQNIYGIAKLAESLEDLPNGDRCTAVLVKRLRCDEKHATLLSASRNTLAVWQHSNSVITRCPSRHSGARRFYPA